MQITRIFNNNAIMYRNRNGREEIALGKGIGYQKKIGDIVDKSQITKFFVMRDENIVRKLEQLLTDIPVKYIEISTEILQNARKILHAEISDILIISMSDHLFASVQRKKEGLSLKNELLWEIKQFYKTEYEIGLQTVELVREKIGVQLDEDEAAFIAMHLINAELNENISSNTNEITKVMQNICSLVKYHFHVQFNPSSVYYYRFMTHLKFFSERMLRGTTYYADPDPELLDVLKMKYVNAYDCVKKISNYLEKHYQYCISDEEKTYLIIHIQRLVYKASSED